MDAEALQLDADYRRFLEIFPDALREPLNAVGAEGLLEVVMDLGRPPEARLVSSAVQLRDRPVSREELESVLQKVGEMGADNRAGIERTLHRISAIRNRRGAVIGLTLRVGRALIGTIDMLRDLVESGRNVLLLGRPGVGKTTKLREIARVLADDARKRVMVVDTSNEIGGDGDIPHPAIGSARRMQVSRPEKQHDVMIEAVENHMPQVIIVDEIGREEEARAARTIAERGVQLIATAHGNTLENLILNPTLSDVVGGVHTVTLSDDEAARRGTLKTVNERRAPPTFEIVVELVGRDEVLVHRNTADAVDAILAGKPIPGERRTRGESKIEIEPSVPSIAQMSRQEASPAERTAFGSRSGREVSAGSPRRLYAHAVSREHVERAIRDLKADAKVVKRADMADAIVSLRSRADDPRLRRSVERSGARVWIVKRNSGSEVRRVLKNVFLVAPGHDDEEVRDAVREAEHAIERALNENVPVPLAPRPSALRKLQHRLATRYRLVTTSQGSEPGRHLVLFPPGSGTDQPPTDDLDEAEDLDVGEDLEAAEPLS